MALFGPLAVELASAGIEVLVPTALTRSLDVRGPSSSRRPAPATGRAGSTSPPRASSRGGPSSTASRSTTPSSPSWPPTQRPLVQLRGQWVVVDPRVAAQLCPARRGVGGRRARGRAVGHRHRSTARCSRSRPSAPSPTSPSGSGSRPRRTRPTSRPGSTRRCGPTSGAASPGCRRWRWLGLGGVLADDMGLGKTIQLIALHLRRIERGDGRRARRWWSARPASSATGSASCARFAPGHHGPPLPRPRPRPRRRRHRRRRVTTYGIARRDRDGARRPLAGASWSPTRRSRSRTPTPRSSRAMRRIPAGARFALTGTPVENRLTELWSLLDWTTPGPAGPGRGRSGAASPSPSSATATRRRPNASPGSSRRSCCGAARTIPRSRPTSRRRPRPTTRSRSRRSRPASTGRRSRRSSSRSPRPRASPAAAWCSSSSPRLKQICNHPAQYLRQPGPLPESVRQARGVRRPRHGDRRRRRRDARVHPVRGDGRAARRTAGPSWVSRTEFLHGGVVARPARGDGRSLPGRRASPCS